MKFAKSKMQCGHNAMPLACVSKADRLWSRSVRPLLMYVTDYEKFHAPFIHALILKEGFP